MLQQQCDIVSIKQIAQVFLQILGGPHPFLELFLLGHRRLGVGSLFVVLMANVFQTCKLLPAAYGFKHGHILVIGVVTAAQRVENVAESLLPL